jgi:GrpB-like predicted nucleotidyltransferase (UPF0157 family)
MKPIVVVDYDPRWAGIFEQLRSRIWPAVSDVATAIEHVGSTAVPGLAAKPIVDISVVVPNDANIRTAIERLEGLGYVHQGNLGVEGREAFGPPALLPRHHLYLCSSRSLALRNHLAVRDYLRKHSDIAAEYGALKKRLARRFHHDIDGYLEGKTNFILGILRTAGFRREELEIIDGINRR